MRVERVKKGVRKNLTPLLSNSSWIDDINCKTNGPIRERNKLQLLSWVIQLESVNKGINVFPTPLLSGFVFCQGSTTNRSCRIMSGIQAATISAKHMAMEEGVNGRNWWIHVTTRNPILTLMCPFLTDKNLKAIWNKHTCFDCCFHKIVESDHAHAHGNGKIMLRNVYEPQSPNEDVGIPRVAIIQNAMSCQVPVSSWHLAWTCKGGQPPTINPIQTQQGTIVLKLSPFND